MSKSHHTQSIGKNYVHKLPFGHAQILETWCSYIVIETYESTVSITQVYNLDELRKRKNKYTIQLFKVESPLHDLFW